MISLTVTGRCASKKNSSRIVRAGGKPDGVPFLLPSRTSGVWNREAMRQLRQQYRAAPLEGPLSAVYRIIRTTNQWEADLSNYVNAIDDALQAAGVIANDRLIVQLLASKHLERDGVARVEITLAPMAEVAA